MPRRSSSPPHTPVRSIADALQAARLGGLRPISTASSTAKKNYAERFSRALAILFANSLRSDFPGITPDEFGRGQEARARTSKGFKKLDVGYSTVELGLALGVSVKTLNFPDASSGRYTKNFTRVDNELRAEATDYHKRQPFAVLAGVLFLPVDSCDDAGRGTRSEAGVSSFGQAVKLFRHRAGRTPPDGDADKFERFFVGLYDPDETSGEETVFFDVMSRPPRDRRLRRPEEGMSFAKLIAEIKETYDRINKPPFEWAP